jgi:hypothetical protein
MPNEKSRSISALFLNRLAIARAAAIACGDLRGDAAVRQCL